jgi:peroxiredoxin Q/BCP
MIMYERTIVSVGSIMPDFTLEDETGREVPLRDFRRGRRYVVLAFVRGEDDPDTRRQLAYLKDDYLRLRHSGGDVLAVSYGSPAFNHGLVDRMSLPFHILGDQDCRVIRMLGLYNRYEKLTGPAIYLLNGAGTVLFMYQGKEPSDIVEDEVILMAMRGDTQTGPDWPLHW